MGRRAFSLVEILVVISIIAIVAAILFPVLGAARRRGDHATCASNLHQLGAALVLYANDHDGWVPPATTQTLAFERSAWMTAPKEEVEASPAALRTAMRPYAHDEQLWFCPSDRWIGTDVLYLGQKHRLTSYWYMPLTEGQLKVWPPRMQLGAAWVVNSSTEAVPLLADAMGMPQSDSDPQFALDFCARSNHPDDLVNALRHDLSLSRLRAKYWLRGAGNDCR